MIKEKTFTATISLGLKEGYNGPQHTVHEVERYCCSFCDENKWCVTVTPTHFCYVNGEEDGCFIGIIQYPRFPEREDVLTDKVFKLASKLRIAFKQERVSIILPDYTYVIQEDL